MIKRKTDATVWMAASAAVALALTASVFAVAGTDAKAIVAALQLTARWSFVLFWLAYAGGPLATLRHWAPESFVRRGREWGLAYAAAQLVHLALIIWFFQISPEPPLTGRLFVFFTIGLVWTYGLAALSFGRLSSAIGPRAWGVIRFLGMNYILLAFARDFVLAPLRSGIESPDAAVRTAINYGPFAALCVAAPALRLAVWLRHRRPDGISRQSEVA